MIVAYVGNFDAMHSTENHVKLALENLGHEVWALPEQRMQWADLQNQTMGADLFLWTRTAGFDPPDLFEQWQGIKRIDLPLVGFHLDRWWGLDREEDVHRSPFFRLDWLFTADGGHPSEWIQAGVKHVWSPPAVLGSECELGVFDQRFLGDVGFVGNLRNYGHKEWGPYRRKLYEHLARGYPKFRLWERGMRGRDLANIYRSVKVLIGDSCLAGDGEELPGGVRGGAVRYFSDRIPETLGRGGFLIHPRVEGVTDGSLYTEGEHLACYELGDFDELDKAIRYYLAHEYERLRIAQRGREHVMSEHLYEHRLERMLEIVLG